MGLPSPEIELSDGHLSAQTRQGRCAINVEKSEAWKDTRSLRRLRGSSLSACAGFAPVATAAGLGTPPFKFTDRSPCCRLSAIHTT